MPLFLRLLLASVLSLMLCERVSADVKEVAYRANVNFTSKSGGVLDFVYGRVKRVNNTITLQVSPYENMESSESLEFAKCNFASDKDWMCTQDNRSITMKDGIFVITNSSSKASDTFKPYKD